jgi:hypothetical protein
VNTEIKTVPDDCPADLIGPPSASSEEALLDIGISLDDHWSSLTEALSGPESLSAEKIIAGQLACRLCDYRDECTQAVEVGQSVGLVERDHPINIETMLTDGERAALWANAAVRIKSEEGYRFQSVANMAAALTRLPIPLRDIAINILRLDSGTIPNQIDVFEVGQNKYFAISWNCSKVIISKSALDEIEKSKASSDQTRAFLANLAEALSPSAENPLKSNIANALRSGNPPRWMRKMNNADILELNSSTHSTLRAFGEILDTPDPDNPQVGITTIVITGATSSAKSGGTTGTSTNKSSKAAEKSLVTLRSVLAKPDLEGSINIANTSLVKSP